MVGTAFVYSPISIHAPAKGATNCIFFLIHAKIISIHAPAKGATVIVRAGSGVTEDFNPRSREGSDKEGRP